MTNITLPRSVVQGALYVIEAWERGCDRSDYWRDRDYSLTALREALEQQERVNQCGETCERAKLCAVCARGLNEQPDQPCKRCNAYATLVKAQEKQLSHYRGQADKYREAIDTLHSERQANATLTEELEQFRAQNAQPEQEPVAWMWRDGTVTSDPDRADGTWTPLYTAPPRREWASLTEEEIDSIIAYILAATAPRVGYRDIARAIEARLKEKNA